MAARAIGDLVRAIADRRQAGGRDAPDRSVEDDDGDVVRVAQAVAVVPVTSRTG
jgi:hypothetical protein